MPSEASDRTSSSLLERARRHDELAWGQLVVLYSPLVLRWCRRANLNAADVEDVCQEVFRAVYRALPGFRRDRPGDSFRAWLRTITRNKLNDHWSRLQPARPEGGSDAAARLNQVPDPFGDDAAEENNEQEVSILFRRAIQVMRTEFEDKTWKAFWLVSVDDEPVDRVAAELGMSPNAIYLARSRIRKRLKEMLADLGEGSPPPASDRGQRRNSS